MLKTTSAPGRIKGHWLVVDLLLTNMSSSVGIMKFPTEWKNKNMFQTTNQVNMSSGLSLKMGHTP